MKEIKLTQGKVALVDDEDYGWLSKFKWYANYYKQTKNFIAQRNGSKINGKSETIYMHRVIVDAPDDKLVDHRNYNSLDNQRHNLRICTRSENARNRKSANSNSSSKYLGVHRHKRLKKWAAQIQVNYKQKRIGLFVSEIDAAIARDKAAIELHGDFASLNFENLRW